MQKDYPEASRASMRDFYVDDLLTGAPTIEALQQLKRDISEVLANARFILRKWNSNTPMLQGADNKTENNVTLGETTKVLGLLWNTTDDTFHYGLKIQDLKGKITKRNILMRVAQIYNPIGWLGPVIVQAKLILQRL